MSEKKPDVKGKASYKSKGERASGGRVPKLNINNLLGALNRPMILGMSAGRRCVVDAEKKAKALIRRASGCKLACL